MTQAREDAGTRNATAQRQVQVRAIMLEAEGIASFELRDPQGETLPAFTAGAHIDVHVKPGCVRQYSLCNDPKERHRYVIAVQRENDGRGGSRALHEDVRIGDLLTIAGPRNHFPLTEGARRHLLIAGGIGVTPMMAMIAELEARGEDYRLYYCTRSREKTAFLDRLGPLVAAGKVKVHHDGGDPARGLDLGTLLRECEPGTHLYYCGPPGFMEAVKTASAHWPREALHFEYFSPPADASAPGSENRPFRIRLLRSGRELEVPADKTIVGVLRENDVFIETSCENGVCGTCLTRYVDGEPDHRDFVLDEADRKEFVLVCCSRSKTPVLVLDL
ncbi:PDR/VanB family oxidoreductase [Pelomicrobium sp. G1]|uniref:PDR/VanB family oxidoreductase n=1 Tax=unclassified Pelomicrobium TaxID=2815318 RepID=UPI0021DEF2ED|nr:MAG: iron-sulfur protein [Burkholderiales bacterium]